MKYLKEVIENMKYNIKYSILDFLAMMAYWIVKNITKDTRLTILEIFLALDPRYGFMYCRDYLQGRFERGEELILQTGYEYVYKRLDLERRFPNPDDQLFKNAEELFNLPSIFFNNKKHHIIFDDRTIYLDLYDGILDTIIVKEESVINVGDILFLHNNCINDYRFDDDIYLEDFRVYSVNHTTREHIEESYILLKLSGLKHVNYKH